jgi:hypothetical protein
MYLGNIALGITPADFKQRIEFFGAQRGRGIVDHLCADPKIDAAQDDAGRSAFELPCNKLASGTLFDPIAQPHELRFTLVGFAPLGPFQVVHGGCADGTGYLPLTVNHRKQDHHPVKFVTEKAAARQCHLTCLLQMFLASSDVLIDCEMRCRWVDHDAMIAVFKVFAGGGFSSAILRRQSASESWGPETNVPLTFVLYQPDTTPSRSDSSVLT